MGDVVIMMDDCECVKTKRVDDSLLVDTGAMRSGGAWNPLHRRYL